MATFQQVPASLDLALVAGDEFLFTATLGILHNIPGETMLAVMAGGRGLLGTAATRPFGLLPPSLFMRSIVSPRDSPLKTAELSDISLRVESKD